MWSSNVIFDGNKYFITDFENAGYNYFLYDFFTYIFTEELVLGNDKLMLMYFDGEFDSILSELFRSLSMEYFKAKKKTYFLGYFIIAYTNKWMKAKSIVLHSKIIHIIKKYQLGEAE